MKYKYILTLVFLILFLLIIVLNRNNSKWDKIIEYNGTNRLELEKVLSHYTKLEKDSLKFQAALFLIKNIGEKYHFKGKELIDYFEFCDSISSIDSISEIQYNKKISNYFSQNGTLVGFPSIKQDIDTISSKYLIKNIDSAFEMFRKAKWKNETSFEDFCEYILPYKIGNEDFEDFRGILIKKYDLQSLVLLPIEEAANSILEKTKKKGMFLANYPNFVPDFPLSYLTKIKGGSCAESSNLAIYIMRACGLPVARDFTPQWPHRARSHSWCALITSKNTCKEFEGVNADKVGGHLLLSTSDNRMAKIYRNTFSKQDSSLAELYGIEDVPETFKSSYIKDVSSQYFKGSSVSINLDTISNFNKKVAYLCVFNNIDWVPIAWSAINNGQAKFKNLGRKVVYLPALFSKGKVIPIGNPILINSEGKIQVLKPKEESRQTLILTRKYPVFDWWDSRTLEMKNGRFQASNNPDFSYATTVYTIKEAPEMKYHTIKIDKQYRYWRYVAAETSYGDIAEIEFISFQDKPISGNIIGTKGFDPEFDKAAVFDNKPLTYYQGATSGNNWVGMDFGEPKTVKTIRFLGRNDDNFINHDDNYELYYWKNNQWISLGKRKDTDKSNTLIYKNAPMGVLFLLRNHTKGREERVFTYMNNQQIWW